MKYKQLIAVCGALVLVIVLGFCQARHIQNRRMATALLAFQHNWVANHYHSTDWRPSGLLADQGSNLIWSADVWGAYVGHVYWENGIEREWGFEIRRTDTNSTTWTLSEFADRTDKNILQRAWERKLLTVKGAN